MSEERGAAFTCHVHVFFFFDLILSKRCRPHTGMSVCARHKNINRPHIRPPPRFLFSDTALQFPTPQMFGIALLCLFPSLLSLLPFSSSYDLVREYSGPTFFDRWDFFGNWDHLTLGMPARIFWHCFLPAHLSS